MCKVDSWYHEKNDGQPYVLLMSSRNIEENLMWSGARETAKLGKSSPTEALQILFKEGFVKLDTLLPQNSTNTGDFLPVWDLVLASRAREFATCSRGCTGACTACNHLGNFADYAMRLRKTENKGSRRCWDN